jgi:hypothetical protein
MAVVHVRRRESDRERDAGGVDHKLALAARSAFIRRIRADDVAPFSRRPWSCRAPRDSSRSRPPSSTPVRAAGAAASTRRAETCRKCRVLIHRYPPRRLPSFAPARAQRHIQIRAPFRSSAKPPADQPLRDRVLAAASQHPSMGRPPLGRPAQPHRRHLH